MPARRRGPIRSFTSCAPLRVIEIEKSLQVDTLSRPVQSYRTTARTPPDSATSSRGAACAGAARTARAARAVNAARFTAPTLSARGHEVHATAWSVDPVDHHLDR